MLSTHYTRQRPASILRRILRYFVVGFGLLILYANTRSPRELTTFDRLVLDMTSPVQGMVSALGRQLASGWERYLALVGVKEDALALEQKVGLLEYRLNVMREVELENARLRRLLEFARSAPQPSRAARVVAFDPSSRYRTLRVDRGQVTGVLPGMAVVTERGVVGRILRAWTHHADVLLATDVRSGIDCMIQRTRARGTVEGTGGELLRMKYLLRLEGVSQGDVVITSGLDGVFPPGLLVGTVGAIQKRSSGVFQEVQILPVVDPLLLEEVLVLDKPLAPAGALVGPPLPPEQSP